MGLSSARQEDEDRSPFLHQRPKTISAPPLFMPGCNPQVMISGGWPALMDDHLLQRPCRDP
jgi:hypothetical protein